MMLFLLTSSLTLQPVFQTALQNHKELLQGRVLGVQRPAQTQRGLDQHFDAQLHHAQQVGPLYRHGALIWQSCKKEITGVIRR